MTIQDRHDILTRLIDLASADTYYHDLYRQRASFYLQQELSQDAYHAYKKMKIQKGALPNQIRNAILQKDWQTVKELTEQDKKMRSELQRRAESVVFAEKIYEPVDVAIDPFSPGMHTLVGLTMGRLKELHRKTVVSLQKLSEKDNDWRGFYQQRLEVFNTLSISDASIDDEEQFVPEVVLEEEAEEALESGNMARLEQLAEKILEGKNDDGQPTSEQLLADKHQHPDDFLYQFSPAVIERAAQFGLSHYQVAENSQEYAPLSRFAWHPTFTDVEDREPHVLQVPDIPFDDNTPEALKARIQMFAVHPFINSSGVRFLPHMVAEDLLVEDFPEPEAGGVFPDGGLLKFLGLNQRSLLDRQTIEAALLAHGNTFVEQELGLDPRQFKLVCIPADLHLRIGQDRGWGQQKIWTHFDGYMVMEAGRRRALAGGDVRYGGIYDLLGISRNYSSERIITRFAVVQRKRLAVWQNGL
ncbi:hypothetical protein HTZ97_09820 [Desulfuromonas acetoxidans]|uniref:Uncharacterized protein n=1 Tax=Desulfuromonas acetoxidans (strain DSM 684 / 11070) TaxID=281689 RepID=Q1K233_DESA6|nr:hypothetical protein [Desulfuromonas acetoxidans]EAT16606.1 hypothetical protein Dace_2701 [Desulfuromonas acetoxidans DSM 684]MBF0644429.1 hypothetical protein [Desulfuromonas acetoxidans]NVD24717.1 hypothetical protein [Desulfuromonas acetoxidans]NVE16762.1 hypothetical protein [Desulfuromonas acetoxidans]